MTKISSRAAWFQKRIFPLMWFGFLAVFLLAVVPAVIFGERSGPWPLLLIIPIVMAIGGYITMKKTVWLLMDEVYDADDYLVVIRNGEEARIPLSEIVNISAPAGRTTSVTLRLRRAGRFGNEIAFIPESSFSFNPFTKNPIVEELITRVDRARWTARNV